MRSKILIISFFLLFFTNTAYSAEAKFSPEAEVWPSIEQVEDINELGDLCLVDQVDYYCSEYRRRIEVLEAENNNYGSWDHSYEKDDIKIRVFE